MLITKFHLNRGDGGRTYRYTYNCHNIKTKNCTNHNTGFHIDGGGNAAYLDRQNVICPGDKKLKQFKLNRDRSGRLITYNYTCCDFDE